jgi:hypothetical protein
VSRVMSQWETLPHHGGGGDGPSVDLPVTVAAAVLGCYVIAGGRGGALHRANTSQYVKLFISIHTFLGMTDLFHNIFYYTTVQ